MATNPNQVQTQGVAVRDRGGAILTLDSDELGIQNIGGTLKQVNPNGTTSSLGGGDSGTLFTLGAQTQDWDFATGLLGDTDGDYEFEGELTANASGVQFTLLPNGVAPTFTGTLLSYANTTVSTAAQTTMLFATAITTLTTCFRIRLQSKSGRNRLLDTVSHDTPATPNTWRETGIWTDTATVITSLRIHASAANGLQPGSYVRFRRLGFTA